MGRRHAPASAFGLGQGAVTGSFNYKIGDLHRRITLDTTDMLTGEKARHGWTDPASGEASVALVRWMEQYGKKT